jgi:hypothetical protein
MSAPANPHHASTEARTLADAHLPPRVRGILETVLQVASAQLEQRLDATLAEFEQQLFRLAQHTRNPAIESGYLQILRTLRMNRADLIPNFLLGLEAKLARLGHSRETTRAAKTPEGAPASSRGSAGLALVEETQLDAELMMRDVAQRSAAGASLPLHLLGQRFGVLAAAPAFDAERVPLGPWSLCTLLQQASAVLQLPPESQLLLLRSFERKAMADYETLAELFNTTLAEAGVLPALSYVPLRVRSSPAPAPGREAEQAAARIEPVDAAGDAAMRGRPHASWLVPADGAPAGAEIDFGALQALLAARRAARPDAQRSATPTLASTGGRTELAQALDQIRASLAGSGAAVSGIDGLKREALVRMRDRHGGDVGLSQDDSDTFDLLDMLYQRIEREVRTDAPAAALLRNLQLPVLDAALRDRAFFTQPQHPARQLLNTVAESGARWLGEQDSDPLLLAPIQRAVDHVVRNAHHDPSAFDSGNQLLQHELQLHARRSEMAERRHIEAARGREKLEIARRQAADTLADLLASHAPPKFVRALIEQTWADVLTLSLLRHGDESEQWQQMLDTTRRIVEASCGAEPAPDAELAAQVEAALAQVGYHAVEAAAIARRLTSHPDAEDGASRTELAAALKSRARLGEGTDAAAPKVDLPPRTPDEQAQYERVRTLPFGTWIEFVVNQQGDVVRRRLSWYSTVTGHALFVNLRGQRAGEQSLDSLARTIARGQARVVTVERARPVDRAWQATLNALRGLAGAAKPRGARA